MTEKDVHVLEEKLDIIIKLLGLRIVEGRTQTEAIKLLASTGLQPKGIADVLGIPRTTVNARLSEMRKSKS